MRQDLPTGTVTFLFTDIEGSTRLLRQLGPGRYAEALADHRRVLREAFVAEGGVEVDTPGGRVLRRFPDRCWGRRLGEVGAAGARFGSDHGAHETAYGNPDRGR
jgi:class 3 adenylate cyclase